MQKRFDVQQAALSRYAEQARRRKQAEEKALKQQEKALQKMVKKGLSKRAAEAELLKTLRRTEGAGARHW